MGYRFSRWVAKSQSIPETYSALKEVLLSNRDFNTTDALDYGDYGLEEATLLVTDAIQGNKKIALYADYDVDGTMSCVSWIWFFQEIGFSNYIFYIPDRFEEGYGVNLKAVQRLVQEDKAQLIITMDTGITANEEALWCKNQGVGFLCTDHHKIQPAIMPDCTILNPKLHPDPAYQELCGCGITFVLLRRLGQRFPVSQGVWGDLLALAGMATICDVVPLNGVNHRLARLGIGALLKSKRLIFQELIRTSQVEQKNLDEQDIGFRLGPRINAVGRLYHGKKVVEAFVHNEPKLLAQEMTRCNDERKRIQEGILEDARKKAAQAMVQDPAVLFLGGDWHEGVIGIAASKLAEEFWRPVLLYTYKADGTCKGSARSILGFDVTCAMGEARELFIKFGGHKAAGGFSFKKDMESPIRERLEAYGSLQRAEQPALWESAKNYDCMIPHGFLNQNLIQELSQLKPFGHSFEEPLFCLESPIKKVTFLKDAQTQKPKHTSIEIPMGLGGVQKILFFHQVLEGLSPGIRARFLVTVHQNIWQGQKSLSLYGQDFEII
jgi:single-stranded-DNA-specific exonuclease